MNTLSFIFKYSSSNNHQLKFPLYFNDFFDKIIEKSNSYQIDFMPNKEDNFYIFVSLNSADIL